jgi:DNA processing protein
MADKFLIALTHFQKFGPASLNKLMALASWQEAYEASRGQFLSLGLNDKAVDEFIAWRKQNNPDDLIAIMEKYRIKAVAITDDFYPPLLRAIHQPPPLLYYQGEISAELFALPVAVVGSRRPSAYGQMAVNRLTKDLAKNNLTIVSGLAFGIDALAHQTAVEVGGKTVAVLGSGIDRSSLYPRANHYLADKIIAQGGVLLSEFPPLTRADKFNFPRRNRIISGTSLGVLVIEAAAKSGSLITAHYGLEQNREVMAVPGNIFASESAGTNHLIKLGARPITKAEDVLEALNLSLTDSGSQTKGQDLTQEETAILTLINEEAKHLDELKDLLKLDISVITSTLTLMEIKGLAKNIGNSTYIKL